MKFGERSSAVTAPISLVAVGLHRTEEIEAGDFIGSSVERVGR